VVGEDGVFQAGPDEGSFLVAAMASGVRGTASMTVAKRGVTPPPPPPPPSPPTGLRWEGEIPSQKWMNFYTKVLSKFAASKGLKLTVRFEVSADGAISQQKIEEAKVALRELGLNDAVSAE
jgi:hypothetical protein